jgi:hypothetical protein
MTESRRFTIKSGLEFAFDALKEIAEARVAGAKSPEEIANALNRGGFPDMSGQQWDEEKVLSFLASRDAEIAQRRLSRGEG